MTPSRPADEVDAAGIDRAQRALAHPLRLQIVRRLSQSVASPVELSREFDLPLGRVAYHVRVLVAAGSLEAVRQRQRRGATETFYRACDVALIDDEQWAELPLGLRHSLQAQVLGEIAEHVTQASHSGGFDRDDMHISWTPLELDETGHEEVVALLAQLLDRLPDVRAAAATRIAAGAPAIRSEVSMLHYLRQTP